MTAAQLRLLVEIGLTIGAVAVGALAGLVWAWLARRQR